MLEMFIDGKIVIFIEYIGTLIRKGKIKDDTSNWFEKLVG